MDLCPITSLPTKNFQSNGNVSQYIIEYGSEIYFINLGLTFNSFCNTFEFQKRKCLLAGAILNGQLFDKEENGYKFLAIGSDWEGKLSKIIYPRTPKDKMDNLLKTLHLFQNYDGEEVSIGEVVTTPAFCYKHFFKNSEECYFYFEILNTQAFIDVIYSATDKTNPTRYPITYKFTLHGINYYLEITELGRLSNKCFVAMSFSDTTKEIREAIREALESTGFDEIIIDEQHINSDTTINDRIIAELKGAKFCIADFTEQKRGVYFESGFAIGQGKPVIYCCRNDHWKDTHFDTKHFAHILYDNPTELKVALINKINAWIK